MVVADETAVAVEAVVTVLAEDVVRAVVAVEAVMTLLADVVVRGGELVVVARRL